GTAIAPRQPTPYRYAVLIARAREVIQHAIQMEAALLAALEKRDAESYNLLKAIQDVELAGETVRLQDLRVMEAEHGGTLAEMQQGRGQKEYDHFDALIDAGVNGGGIGGRGSERSALWRVVSSRVSPKRAWVVEVGVPSLVAGWV